MARLLGSRVDGLGTAGLSAGEGRPGPPSERTAALTESIGSTGRRRLLPAWLFRALRQTAVRGSLVRFVQGTIGVGVAIGIWQLLRLLGVLPRSYAPSFDSIVVALADSIVHGELPSAVADTLTAWAAGLGLAILIAVPLGFATGLFRWVDAAAGPTVDFLRPIPSVSLIPVAILVFGIGLQMQLMLIVFATAWPLLFNAHYGVRSVDPLLVENGRISGLSRLGVILRVIVPASLPAVFTGVRIASAIALILAITAEMVGGSPGLGYFIIVAEFGGQIPLSYAGVLATGLLGLILNGLLLLLGRFVLRWSVAYREVAP